jgi:aminoglycoside phosphotransferase (APT) family kinase protein
VPTGKLHDDEVAVDVDLVRRLLAAQHPQWADLPIEQYDSTGTSNSIFRVGADLSVRMPRVARSMEQVTIEQRWLPQLAPVLPLAIPVPLAIGEPGEGYPYIWAIAQWLDGESAATAEIDDPRAAATDLGQFVAAMRRVDTTGGRRPGDGNFYRGCPLADRDVVTRHAIGELAGKIDLEAATAAWEHALATPALTGPPVWIHGDLMAGNLIVDHGRLHAVIDFGGLGVGDPACDLIVAWNFFSGAARATYRAVLEVDDDTWARGRGWALSVALLQLPYYEISNPALAAIARFTIDQVLADHP